MYRRMHYQEKGVVLLTCLVFLLVLLAMLRFTMTSARVEEQKAGIDLEIVSARESAQAAINFAESYIRRQGELYCLSEGIEKTECEERKDLYVNLLFSMSDSELTQLKLSEAKDLGGVPNINEIVKKGFYSATFVDSKKKDCDPFWACVDWDGSSTNAAHAVHESAKLYGAKNQSMPAVECKADACKMRGIEVNSHFIIERFNPEELVDARGDLQKSGKIIILRITAVGYGRGGINNNLTNAILQSSYVLFNG